MVGLMNDDKKFWGREAELARLAELWAKRTASLVTLRGRRRIGKSTLAEEFAGRSGARLLKLEGLRPKSGMTDADERTFFASKLSAQTGCDRTAPEDWYAGFARLDREIGNGRTVVLLDEVSWMAHFANTFPEIFKNAWDDLFKKHRSCIFILCGSVSSWIRENFVRNRAFVGRRSLDIVLGELPPDVCVRFWGRKASRIDPREIVDVLSVTGGVPRYLEEIDPSLSASENIRRLCFMPHGVLREDFDDMFADVIDGRAKFSAKALRTFVDGPKSATEVAKALKIEKGGDVSAVLDGLVEAGFLALGTRVNPETGLPIRERRYRLRDNYTRFYLKCVESNKDAIDEGSFAFASLDSLDEYDAVMGLAFENLVVNNWRRILPALHMEEALVTSAGPYFRHASKSPRGKPGVQIDLLVQTKRTFCVVEIKRKREIGKDVVEEVDRKIRALGRPAGVSAKAVLVYDGHLSPSVSAEAYFDAIVSFRDLLGLCG